MLLEEAKKSRVFSVVSILVAGWISGVSTVELYMKFNGLEIAPKKEQISLEDFYDVLSKNNSVNGLKKDVESCLEEKKLKVIENDSLTKQLDRCKNTKIQGSIANQNSRHYEGILETPATSFDEYISKWDDAFEKSLLDYVQREIAEDKDYNDFESLKNMCSEEDVDCLKHFSECAQNSEAIQYGLSKFTLIQFLGFSIPRDEADKMDQKQISSMFETYGTFINIRNSDLIEKILSERLFKIESQFDGPSYKIRYLLSPLIEYSNKIESINNWKSLFENLGKDLGQLSASKFYEAGFPRHENKCLIPYFSEGFMGLEGWYYSFWYRRYLEGTYDVTSKAIRYASGKY